MSDDRKKVYSKKPTGTVPKTKYRNNASQANHDGRIQNISSNNLVPYDDSRDCYQPKLKFSGNPDLLKRNFLIPKTIAMDTTDDQRSAAKQNGTGFTSIYGSNGPPSTPSTSASASRRNSTSTAPKSDNVSKYPDKKHIEDRLLKIREYLNATSSLITNMKNTDEQGSEPGVETLDKAELEKRYDQANREIQMLQEQENMLLNLQLAAENQLKDARQAHQKLALVNKGTNQARNAKIQSELTPECHLNGVPDGIEGQNMLNKNSNEVYFDTVRTIDERLRNINEPRGRTSGSNINENMQTQIEALQQHLTMLRDSNDSRNHLIQVLDNRDAQLRSEHIELQGRLLELQNKKTQVDLLVSQLQSMNEESEDEEVGAQVRRIVTMKDQLAKLKEMLEVVKSTESILETQNVNESDLEVQENAHALPAKSDNLRRSTNCTLTESNSSGRVENPSNRSSNVRKVEKQVNKSSIKANEREKIKLQEELQAKKRELEELMYKHKAVSSNLNQDVHTENKTDHFNIQFDSDVESWRPMTNSFNLPPNTCFSVPSSASEDCPEEDINEYSEFNSSGDTNNTSFLQPMPSLNYPTSNYIKHRDVETHSARSVPSLRNISKTPDRSTMQSTSVASTLLPERGASNSEQDLSKTQMQKKLELIRSVCDSILTNQSPQDTNLQQLRNNLTPSPLYSEPRQFGTPNSQIHNALSTVNPVGADPNWVPAPMPQYAAPDMANYQNFLATNTLQTQAFMLNTLNQCCQMLWLQQRELAALRNTVSMMMERYPIEQNTPNPNIYMNSTVYPPTNSSEVRPHPHARPSTSNNSNQKSNHVSSATSLPNLSHMPHTNHEAAACANNMSARVIESNLNNSVAHNHQNEIGEHSNNIHPMGQPLPSQIWNGQALNNQVAPGNRANNYWDNFRSYSRQNLLSTKSNDGTQNASSDRSHNSVERSNSYTLPSASVPKLNTEHQDSANTSVENTPRRRACFKTIRVTSGENIDIVHNIPPDVLNVNQSQKSNENHDLFDVAASLNHDSFSGAESSSSFPNTCRHNASQSINMNLHQENLPKQMYNYRQNRYRNLWPNTQQEGPKTVPSLYSSEMRENIFRGVTNLIATNEERPHFLIQLLRGLQKVKSDQMRCRTLQSLQAVFTNPDEILERQEHDSESDADAYDREGLFRLWPQSSKICDNNDSMTSTALDIDYMLSEVVLFLNANAEETFHFDFVDVIRDLLIQSRLSTIPKDEVLQRYFTSLLECSVANYRGKLIKDVKANIVKAVEDLLKMDLRKFIREDQETGESTDEDENLIANNLAGVSFDINSQNSLLEDANPPQMQNGDLAEADQSRLELQEEEEGAVGGLLNIFVERRSPNPTQIAPDEAEITKIEFSIDTEAEAEFSEQGLDQVPTRLTTRSRPGSNTSNKDCCSSRSDTAEQF